MNFLVGLVIGVALPTGALMLASVADQPRPAAAATCPTDKLEKYYRAGFSDGSSNVVYSWEEVNE